MKSFRAVGALVLLATVTLTACSGPAVVTSLRAAKAPRATASVADIASTAPSAVAMIPAVASVASPTSSATAPTASPIAASPEFALVRRLRALATVDWTVLRDTRTGTAFELPGAVAEKHVTTNGVAQRLYAYQLSKQTGVSVSFVHTASPAAAIALLPIYPAQLARSFTSLGADDAAVSEQRSTYVDGKPALTFRFAFTPPTVPQIPPVWLTTAIATGADIVLLQTIVFPASTHYDYLGPARLAQQRLIASVQLP